MAEFVQIMKDWRRMCQHMEKIGGDRSCDICLLGGCNAIYEDDGNTDYAEIEEKVAAWAAEHPEPVYPTWRQWFVKNGIATEIETLEKDMPQFIYKPIPADIAEKLGLKPKEGA